MGDLWLDITSFQSQQNKQHGGLVSEAKYCSRECEVCDDSGRCIMRGRRLTGGLQLMGSNVPQTTNYSQAKKTLKPEMSKISPTVAALSAFAAPACIRIRNCGATCDKISIGKMTRSNDETSYWRQCHVTGEY